MAAGGSSSDSSDTEDSEAVIVAAAGDTSSSDSSAKQSAGEVQQLSRGSATDSEDELEEEDAGNLEAEAAVTNGTASSDDAGAKKVSCWCEVKL